VKRLAVITGAAGGIGQAIVADLLAHDYDVVGIVRTAPEQQEQGAHYIVADVSTSAAVDDAFLKIIERFGRIDVLVTSAAILRSAPVHETTDEMWDEVIATNLRGVFLSCRAALRSMIVANSGVIVTLSSVHAVATMRGTGAYAASKGAIVSLSRQMAVEYADNNIRVNSLVIGSVDTRMTELHKELLLQDGVSFSPQAGAIGRMASPREIASAVRFLAGDDSSFMTGSSMTVDGGLLSALI
jgi:NAD(P)-dependent dehydrogenase (short-subunit alcohol dehydrogenase family)